MEALLREFIEWLVGIPRGFWMLLWRRGLLFQIPMVCIVASAVMQIAGRAKMSESLGMMTSILLVGIMGAFIIQIFRVRGVFAALGSLRWWMVMVIVMVTITYYLPK